LLHLLPKHNPKSADFKLYGNVVNFTFIGILLEIGNGSGANYVERALAALLLIKKDVIV
jgi:hypothetical protein